MKERNNDYHCVINYKALLKEFDRVIELNGNSQYAKFTLHTARSIVQAFTNQTEKEMDDYIRLTSTVVPPPLTETIEVAGKLTHNIV